MDSEVSTGWVLCGVAHVATIKPLRLRIEHQLGYKMAKWVHRIELVADWRHWQGPKGLARRRAQLLRV
jgi:hypothetical protein